MRGAIQIDEIRCKGCELCTAVCTKHVIGIADYFTPRGYRPAQYLDPQGLCTGCLLCATICPDAAITVFREASRPTAHAAHPTPSPARASAASEL